jgi:hypothetical protein
MSNSEEFYATIKPDDSIIADPERALLFFKTTPAGEMLRFAANGDIFIKGKLVTNDLEIVEGMRELLVSGKYLEQSTCDLSNELAQREGVEEIVVGPYEPYKITVAGVEREMSGPATILINID